MIRHTVAFRLKHPRGSTEEKSFLDAGKAISVRPRGRFKADNGPALLVAALEGLGIAYLPDFLTDEHIASGALVAVLTRYRVPEGGLFLIRPAGAPSRKVRVLTDLLLERFHEHAVGVNYPTNVG